MDPNDLKPAPEPLRLVQEFVNTRSNLRDLDQFDDVRGASRWLDEHGLLSGGGALLDSDRLCLISFRENLRGVLSAHTSGVRDGEMATGELDDLTRDALLQVSFDPSGEPRLRPADGIGVVERAIAVMLVAATESAVEGTWRRLKACRNEACRWAFFDTSRNRSGTWCDMDTCGARHKMRAYRQRKSG